MNKISVGLKNKILCGAYVTYFIVSLSYYGWFVVAFLITYSPQDDFIIGQRLRFWMSWQEYNILILSVALLVVSLVRRKVIKALALERASFYRHLFVQTFVFLISLLNFILFHFQSYVHLLDLAGFVITVWAIYSIGFQFYKSQNTAWNHPTTIGSSFISALLLGISILVLLNVFKTHFYIPLFWFILLLFIDMFIYIARFRYFVSASSHTNLLAKKLMGSLLLYTGLRLIIGIFIPLVYAFYIAFSGLEIGNGMAVMIIIGQIIDRTMFICSDTDFEV